MTSELNQATLELLAAANGASSWGPEDVMNDAPFIAAAVLKKLNDYSESMFDPHEGKVGVVRIDLINSVAAELLKEHGIEETNA